MNYRKRISLLLFFFLLNIVAYSQQPPEKMKLGKVSKEMLSFTQYEKDTSAIALVLGEFGNSSFESSQSSMGFLLKKHVRIKILKKEGLSYADILLPYQDSYESITSIKGYVYNLVDGEIVKEKLEKDNIFLEKIVDGVSTKKISFTNVKVGSVIEYSYSKKTESVGFPGTWKAQRDIPVLVSDFKFTVPDMLNYKIINSRYFMLHELEPSSSSKTFVLGGNQSSLRVDTRHWREEHIPAFEKEPFMTSPEDYIARLEPELISIDGSMSYTRETWEGVLKGLYISPACGGQLSKTSFLKEELTAISVQTEDKKEKAKLVYDLIREHMTWNEQYGCFTSEGGTRKAYKNRKGNVADINLMLIAALREVGVSAFPLIGSTRDFGKVVRSNPSLAQLSYVIAYIQDGEIAYYLDATSKNHSFGKLPKRALNYQGVIMSNNEKVNGQFIDIVPQTYDNRVETLQLEINSDLTVKGHYKGIYRGYEGIKWRNEYKSFDDEDEYLTKIEEETEGLIVNDYSKENLKNIDESPLEEFDFEWENAIEKAGAAYVINPLEILNINENPFKRDERLYPVEFPCPIKTKFMIQVKIPEGFTVKELPKSLNMALIDKKSGSIRYLVSQNGNTLTLMVDFKINRLVFVPEEYTILKRFFEEAYSIQNSPIVLVQNQ